MNHLRLLLRRKTMISLCYSSVDGIVCGDVAMDIVNELQPHALKAQTPSPMRFHMAFSLGGAVLILATLLCRDLSAVRLQGHRASYVESYRQGMNMLQDIASYLIAARRILADLKEITQVADMLLENTPLQGPDFAGIVPPNVEDLFPYGSLGDFDAFVGAEGWDGAQYTEPMANDELGLCGSWNSEILWS